MDKRFFTNLGNDIKKATESKDFSQLGQNISDTVNQTVNDVLNSVQDAMKQVSSGPKVTVVCSSSPTRGQRKQRNFFTSPI